MTLGRWNYGGTDAALFRTIKNGVSGTEMPPYRYAEEERVKWVRVYRVPDIVFFSHRNHLKAGEKCVTCHGPVASRHVLAKEVSTSMTSCMNCHRSRRVPNECYLCHDLGQ